LYLSLRDRPPTANGDPVTGGAIRAPRIGRNVVLLGGIAVMLPMAWRLLPEPALTP